MSVWIPGRILLECVGVREDDVRSPCQQTGRGPVATPGRLVLMCLVLSVLCCAIGAGGCSEGAEAPSKVAILAIDGMV